MTLNQEITLQNIYIELKRDQHSRTYFLIHDKDTNLAYFAFHWQVKKGWFDLETNWAKAKVVGLKLDRQDRKKVISFRILESYSYFPKQV